MSDSTAVEKRDASSEVTAPAPLDLPAGMVLAYDPAMFPNLRYRDPDAIRRRFAERFMAAGTMAELNRVLEGNTTDKMVGKAMEIRGVEWEPYESEGTVRPNAICAAVDIATGELLEFATTSEACTLYLSRAEQIGGLPLKVRIVEKLTRSGQKALNFEAI